MKRLLTPTGLVIICAVAAYLWVVQKRVSPYIGGSDSSGYYNNSLLLAQGRITADQRTLPGLSPDPIKNLYVPLGFVERPGEHAMVSTYPIGIPLLTLATAFFTGWDWVPGWTAAWNLLLGIALFYPLGRCFGLAKNWALFGTALLALSPLYLSYGLQYMSDVPSLAWCEAAILCAFLSARHSAWALGAGVAFALAVLIRPTNALLLAPLALVFGFGWKRWLCFGLGGLPGGVFFAFHNYHAYGAILTAGNVPLSMFKWEYVLPSLRNYVVWIPLLFTPFTLLALLLPFSWKRAAQKYTVLALWALPFLGLYAAYECTPQVWWYLRFILPCIPSVLIGSLLVAQTWCQKRGYDLALPGASRRQQIATVLILAGCFTLQGVMTSRLNVLHVKKDDGSYRKSAEWLNQHAPGGACVLTMQSSGSIFAYTPYTVLRWDMIHENTRSLVVDAVAKNHRPLYAVLYPFEEQDAFARYPGNWREVYRYRWVKVWFYEGPPAPAS